MDTGTSLRLADAVSMRKVRDEAVLLDLASEQYFGLDAVGTCVVDTLSAGGTVDAAVEAVLAAFDAPADQVRGDIEALVDEMLAAGLLVVTRS